VLRALQAAGYDASNDDMVDRRMKAAKLRSEVYRRGKQLT
jgi:hypothetical protein